MKFFLLLITKFLYILKLKMNLLMNYFLIFYIIFFIIFRIHLILILICSAVNLRLISSNKKKNGLSSLHINSDGMLVFSRSPIKIEFSWKIKIIIIVLYWSYACGFCHQPLIVNKRNIIKSSCVRVENSS